MWVTIFHVACRSCFCASTELASRQKLVRATLNADEVLILTELNLFSHRQHMMKDSLIVFQHLIGVGRLQQIQKSEISLRRFCQGLACLEHPPVDKI
jgi:hypothetical protein